MAKTTDPLAGFHRATSAEYNKHRLIGISCGEPGSRKTSFWLEAPGPIVIFSLDQGLEGVINRVLDEQPHKDIRVCEYTWIPRKDDEDGALQQRAIEIRDEFTEKYEIAIQNARTVILDKESDWWSLYQYAEWGAERGEQRGYDGINSRMRGIINAAKATDINLGLIDSMKDQWGKVVNKRTGAVGSGPTGQRVRAGFKEAAGLVHLELTHSGVGPESWAMTVGKVRGPATGTIAGETYGPLSFGEFAQMVFPDSEESEWS